MSRLKTELSWLRRRGAVRADDDEEAARACGRCKAELGVIINRGAACRACRKRVCKQCREYTNSGRDWVCIVCHKHIEIQLASGEWMNEFVRRPSRRRENNVYVPPTDVVKKSLIKRSWTISRSDLREDGTQRDFSAYPSSGGRTSPEPRTPDGRLAAHHHRVRQHRPPADENEPPWDDKHPPARRPPPRRYSMSSLDGVVAAPRHPKGPAPSPPQEYQSGQDSTDNGYIALHPSVPYLRIAPKRRLLPEVPNQTYGTSERPSTLPRNLRRSREDRHSSNNVQLSPPAAHDPARFHSMPRTRSRSPSGPGRGRSEPSRRAASPVAPLRENLGLGGYVSSGPVTSTPINHDPGIGARRGGLSPPTAAPRDLSRHPANGRPPDQTAANLRRLPQSPGQGVTRIIEIEMEGEGSLAPPSRAPASRTNSAVSSSSRSSDHNEGEREGHRGFTKVSRSHASSSPDSRSLLVPSMHMPQPRQVSSTPLRQAASSPLLLSNQSSSSLAHSRPSASMNGLNSDDTSVGGEDSGGGGGGGGGGAGGGGEMSATPGGGGGGGGMGLKSGSPSPLVGSVGRISGRDSVASLTSSTDTSCLTHPDEDIERLLQLNEKKISSLTPLGSRSESMASVCSAGAEGRYGTVIIRGEIELGLQYNYKEGQLEVHVAQCRDLAAVDTKRNRSDPYVKVYLLPDKSKSGKRKTKVKKHTLNPVFEDVLKFSTTMSELESRTLWVSVWHSDMFGRNDFLGEVVISLADTVFDDVSPKWYPLQDRIEPLEELSYSPRGDLILALKFVPPDAVSSKKARRSRGALHVLVKEAKSLAAVRAHGTADPICKGLLLPEKGKASKQKTSVCRKTLNPTWNHTLVFDDTSLQELTERALELSVWDHDRLGPSHFLGGCRLSLGKGNHGGRPVEWMEAAGMEVKLWEQMLDRPNLWVEGSIMLRTTMDKPIYSSSMTE